MTAKTGGKYPCLTNRNCPVFAFCNDGHCVCSDELSGDGENCQARENNLILYVCYDMNNGT